MEGTRVSTFPKSQNAPALRSDTADLGPSRRKMGLETIYPIRSPSGPDNGPHARGADAERSYWAGCSPGTRTGRVLPSPVTAGRALLAPGYRPFWGPSPHKTLLTGACSTEASPRAHTRYRPARAQGTHQGHTWASDSDDPTDRKGRPAARTGSSRREGPRGALRGTMEGRTRTAGGAQKEATGEHGEEASTGKDCRGARGGAVGQWTRRGPVQAGRFLGSEHVRAAVPEPEEGAAAENRRAGPESASRHTQAPERPTP